jgi:hypothetical protein
MTCIFFVRETAAFAGALKYCQRCLEGGIRWLPLSNVLSTEPGPFCRFTSKHIIDFKTCRLKNHSDCQTLVEKMHKDVLEFITDAFVTALIGRCGGQILGAVRG